MSGDLPDDGTWLNPLMDGPPLLFPGPDPFEDFLEAWGRHLRHLPHNVVWPRMAVAAGVVDEAVLREAILNGDVPTRTHGPHVFILPEDFSAFLATLPARAPQAERERKARAKRSVALEKGARRAAAKPGRRSTPHYNKRVAHSALLRALQMTPTILELRANGIVAARDVAAELTKRGVPTPWGKAEWSPESAANLTRRIDAALAGKDRAYSVAAVRREKK